MRRTEGCALVMGKLLGRQIARVENDRRSGPVGKQLNADGFEKVNIMTGGMMEWSNLQLPVVNNG